MMRCLLSLAFRRAYFAKRQVYRPHYGRLRRRAIRYIDELVAPPGTHAGARAEKRRIRRSWPARKRPIFAARTPSFSIALILHAAAAFIAELRQKRATIAR